ncbi:hypothetical protein Dimus_008980 [Dionaea muscipula]
MYRSSSTTRVTDEYPKYSISPPSQTSGGGGGNRSPVDDDGIASHNHSHNQLPLYNHNFHVSKREKSRLRSSDNAVHFIPLVLLLCVIILWFFSNPVDVVKKADSLAARVEALKVAVGVDVDGTQNSLLHHLVLEDAKLGGDKTGKKPLGQS